MTTLSVQVAAAVALALLCLSGCACADQARDPCSMSWYLLHPAEDLPFWDPSAAKPQQKGFSLPYRPGLTDREALIAQIDGSPVLTIAVWPENAGTTTPTEGNYAYPENTIVWLSASSSSAYLFDHWEGDVSDPNLSIAAVFMDTSKSVTAAFVCVPTGAKRLANTSYFSGLGSIVTAAFTDFFYIEGDRRECGIRVDKPGHGLTAGMRADVSGYVKTNADGERYIDAETIAENGTGSVAPLGVTNRALGGGNWLYNGSTGAGQEGVQGGKGLNNIGLLVHVWGEVKQKASDYFYIDDGSHLSDGTQTDQVDNVGVRVLGSIVGYGPGDYLGIVGVSSCFRTTGGLRRLVRLRGVEDVYDLVHGTGTVAMPTISPMGGEYHSTVQAVLACAVPAAAIRYTVDGTVPTETSTLYDPAGVVVVPHSLTVKAKAFKPGWDPSTVASAAYSIVPSPPYQYYYQVTETHAGPGISGLRVTDVFKPNSVRLQWYQWGGTQPRFEVKRYEYDEWTLLTENATEEYFVDTQCPLVPGTTYTYAVRGYGGENQDKGLPEPPEGADPNKIWHHIHYTYSPWANILMTPGQEIGASENQAVDSRYDLRYADNRLLDFQFKNRAYRGGLFAGYGVDPSRVGRSFVKFPLSSITPSIPQDQYLWTAGVSLYYARSFANGQTVVGCQTIADDSWNAESLNWTTAPALNPANATQKLTLSFDSSDPPAEWSRWCVLPVFGDICREMRGDGALSLGLASMNETSPGWAYFAKKEYDPALAPTIMYAYGAPGPLVADVKLSATEVVGGQSVIATATLSHPAPANGVSVYCSVSQPAGYGYPVAMVADPDNVTVPTGETQCQFVVCTHVLRPPESSPVTISVSASTGLSPRSCDLRINP